MIEPSDLAAHPSPLARHYTRFRVADRLLLSGHSHQAWPDVAREALVRSFDDAAEHVDGKWPHAFDMANAVRLGYARLMDDDPQRIALGECTHVLVVRWLSALDLAARPRIVTTAGEFHAIRRQLDVLAAMGIEVVRVPVDDLDAIPERVASAIDDATAAVMVSAVLFRSARIVPGLDRIAAAARRHGARLLVDAYHALAVMPFPLDRLGLEDAYVTGGGYKYCQLGEGNAFLRTPPGCDLRPRVTGWFAEFEDLTGTPREGEVTYAPGPMRWAGGTYEPASHYRAAAVFDFFSRHELTPERLRRISRHQVARLAAAFDALDLDPSVIRRERDVPLERIAGFLALRAPRAGEIRDALLERGVWCDSRGDVLRLGPAPYLSDVQLDRAMAILGEVVRAMAPR